MKHDILDSPWWIDTVGELYWMGGGLGYNTVCYRYCPTHVILRISGRKSAP